MASYFQRRKIPDKGKAVSETPERNQTPSETPVQENSLQPKKKYKKEISVHHEGNWRTARIFISSTFKDMHGERDLLTRKVFPELQDRCNTLRVHLTPVDLRWGVTEDQTNQAVELCLTEVDQCRPFFIGLLGERYGWIANPSFYPQQQKFDWLQSFRHGCSVTHLEMHYGCLMSPATSRACFYFRDPKFLDDVPYEILPNFASEDDHAAKSIRELKDEIRKSCNRVFDGYPCKWGGVVQGKPVVDGLDELGEQMVEDLWEQILEEFPPSQTRPDELTVERSYHDFFVENHSRGFVGREDLLQKLDDHVTQSIISVKNSYNRTQDAPAVIVGEPGGGKTSLVATFVKRLKETSQKEGFNVIYHFVGAAPGSTNLRRILNRLCQELVELYRYRLDPVPEIPQELSELQTLFLQLLNQAKESYIPLVLVIDALNQMDDTDNPSTLAWFPELQPENVCLIVSTLAGQFLTRLQSRKISKVTVGPLSLSEKKEIVRKTLWEYRKKLDERPGGQMDQLLAKKESSKPLYLFVACEELRVFGVFEQLSERIASLPETVPQLFEEVIARLEVDHGNTFVSDALSLLVCSRGGLQETEIVGLLGLLDHRSIASTSLSTSSSPESKNTNTQMTSLPHAIWSRLYRSLRSFLRPPGDNGEGVLDFFHRQLAKAIQVRYFPKSKAGDEHKHFIHKQMARYFAMKANPADDGRYDSQAKRAISELPYHLRQAEMSDQLAAVLTSLSFIEAKATIGLAFELLFDYMEAEALLTEQSPSYPQLHEMHEFVRSRTHILARTPHLTFSLAFNMPDSSVPAKLAKKVWVEASDSRPFVRWLNKRQQADPCQMTLAGHTHPIRGAMWNPNPEMQQIVSASDDDTLKVWNSVTGAELFTLKGHGESAVSCAYSPDGSLIASSSYDRTIKIWSAVNGVELRTLTEHTSAVNKVKFSPDGRHLLSVSNDKRAIVWSTESWEIVADLRGHTGHLVTGCFSPDGKEVITTTVDKTALIWSVAQQTVIGRLQRLFAPVNEVIYAPDGLTFVTGGDDRTVRIWDRATQQLQRELKGHKDGVVALAFANEGNWLISGSHDNTIRFFDVHTGAELGLFVGHTGSVLSLSLSPDLKRFVTSSFDRSLKVWTLATDFASSDNHEARILDCVCSADGTLIVTASRDKTLKIWDGVSHRLLHTLQGHISNVFGCAISPDKQYVASASRDKSVKIWSVQTGKEIRTLLGHKQPVNDCAFSPDGTLLMTVADDKLIKLWDVETGVERATLYGHRAPVTCCAFSRDGTRIVTGSADSTLKIWDTKRRAKLGTILAHKARITCCDFSVDGTRVVSGAEDHTVRIFDSRNARLLMELSRHTATLTDCRYSKNGRYVITGSTDSYVIMWDAETGEEVSSFACSARVTAVAVGGADHRFCVGDGSGTLLALEAVGLKQFDADVTMGDAW